MSKITITDVPQKAHSPIEIGSWWVLKEWLPTRVLPRHVHILLVIQGHWVLVNCEGDSWSTWVTRELLETDILEYFEPFTGTLHIES